MTYLDWLSVKLFGNPCLFFEGVVGAICCSGILELLTNSALEILQEIDKIGPRMPQWRPKLVQGGTPQRFPKNRSQKKHATAGKSHATGYGAPNRKVGDFVGDILRYFTRILFEMNFEWYFGWFLDRFLHVFHDLFGCLRVSFWNQLI